MVIFTFTFMKVKIQKSALKIESRILRIKSVGREPEKFLLNVKDFLLLL